jgi:hypothetical protein
VDEELKIIKKKVAGPDLHYCPDISGSCTEN